MGIDKDEEYCGTEYHVFVGGGGILFSEMAVSDTFFFGTIPHSKEIHHLGKFTWYSAWTAYTYTNTNKNCFQIPL